METELKQTLQKIANTVRILSMDAVQKANSGHPGLPLGCAELGAYLWGHHMRYNAKDSSWLNRDRFVLSAGHGCMFQYALLHLAGYKLSLDDIKHFRQLHSKTPGHPEYGHTDGIEVTTGPLGQGVANAVGLALGFKLLGAKFNTPSHKIIDNKVFCLAGDGCIMEGISSEASSFAGHLGLDNLVLIYDSNQICLDGPLSECCSENTHMRYKSYGFDVFEIDGYDFDKMEEVFSTLRTHQKKPALIIVHTIIGKGSPHKAGSHKAHGSPLGPDEVKATKEALGLPLEEFYVPQAVLSFFKNHQEKLLEEYNDWQQSFAEWSKADAQLYQDFEEMANKRLPDDLEKQLKSIKIEDPIAGRSASQEVICYLANILPQLYGGSADLSGSDATMIKQFPLVSPGHFKGRNMKYGVREFAMAGISAGLFTTGLITPFCGTFFTFSDYMRNAIRLAALSKYQVIYQFTHDSIFLGEDGPTHQSVEQLMSLRAMPNLNLFRPADSNEIKMCWLAALQYEGPSAIVLTRQKLPNLPHTDVPYAEGVGRGAYIIVKEHKKPDVTLFATGSELSLALDVSDRLKKLGKEVRVISMPCWRLFELQDDSYQESVVGGDLGKRVSIEAGSDLGWYKYIGRSGIAVCMESFGASAPSSALATEFGFTADQIVERILNG